MYAGTYLTLLNSKKCTKNPTAYFDSQIDAEYGTGILFASNNSNKRNNREQYKGIFFKVKIPLQVSLIDIQMNFQ